MFVIGAFALYIDIVIYYEGNLFACRLYLNGLLFRLTPRGDVTDAIKY